MTNLTPLPDPPSRAVPSTFAAKADAFLGALPTFATEANQLALDVNSDAAAAAVSAASAMGYSNIALSAANFAGDWEDQAGAAAPPYAVWHAGNYWQLVNAVLDVSAAAPGQTADWRVIGDKITVSTIADLRLISGVGVSSAYLIGHTSPNDGGHGVFYWDSDSVLTDNGGTIVQVTGGTTGRWIRQLNGFVTPEMFGGLPGITAYEPISVMLDSKTYTILTDATFSDPVAKFTGQGYGRLAGVFNGSVITGDGGVVFSAGAAQQGLNLADFALVYTGAGTALKISNFLNSQISNLYIDLQGLGDTGIDYSGNSSFFSVLENCTVSSFKGTGVKVNSIGTKHVLRDCAIGSAQSTAISGVEVNVPGVSIYDGQINVNHTGDMSGIGILFNNLTGAIIQGGLVVGTLSEFNTGVKITGATHGFQQVVVRNPRYTLGSGQIGIVFGRAYSCLLENPTVYGPTGGTIAVWEADSVQCGLIGGYDACRAGISVDPAAVGAYKICTEPLTTYAQRDNITTAANLITTVNECQYVGKSVHNGTSWDKFSAPIPDDGFATFIPPEQYGTMEITTTSGGGDYILANYNTQTGSCAQLTVGSSSVVNASNGALGGTTGTDGSLTVRCSSDGKVYVENRRGGSRRVIIHFKSPGPNT